VKVAVNLKVLILYCVDH